MQKKKFLSFYIMNLLIKKIVFSKIILSYSLTTFQNLCTGNNKESSVIYIFIFMSNNMMVLDFYFITLS